MFQLTAEQLARVAHAQEQRFLTRLQGMHDSSDQPPCPEPGAEILYRQWMEEAVSVGFRTDYEMAVYITACRKIGMSVLNGPQAWKECALDSSRTPARRAQRLEGLFSEPPIEAQP